MSESEKRHKTAPPTRKRKANPIMTAKHKAARVARAKTRVASPERRNEIINRVAMAFNMSKGVDAILTPGFKDQFASRPARKLARSVRRVVARQVIADLAQQAIADEDQAIAYLERNDGKGGDNHKTR